MRNGEILLFLQWSGIETQLSKIELSSQLCASFDLCLITSSYHFPMYEVRKKPNLFLLDIFIGKLLWASSFSSCRYVL